MSHFLFRSAAVASTAALLAVASPALAKPVIGMVTPVTAAANTAVVFTAAVQSATPIQSCNLYVDLADVGEMTVSGGVASKSYTFPYGGSRIAFVFCRDTSGGMAAGANTAIWVTGALQNEPPLSTPSPEPTPEPNPTPTPTPTPEPTPEPTPSTTTRRLIKLVCPSGAGADDPCKAVYYVGTDGKRHAFPNSKVYFTWYSNFDSVVDVTSQELSAYTLGANVTYRPGVRLVKFTTDPKVYAVSSDGVLRWVKTEELARAFYGTDWNTKIDDIPDAFYTNYTFGAEVVSTADFAPATETAAAPTID